MASKLPAVKNSAFVFRAVLFAQSDNQIKSNPTIAAGDFKASVDGAAFANLTTLPDVDPDSTVQVKISLSADEMNGDEIMVTAIDASGAEWHSAAWVIHTAAQTFDTMDANIDAVLEDTGTTLPATLTTIDGIVDDILVDTGTTLDTLVKDIPTVAEFEARTLPTADYFDAANDLVKLHGTQGAVTFGQVKIAANAANEGALHLTNTNGDGVGLYAQGQAIGQHNTGAIGVYNEGDGVGGAGTYHHGTNTNGVGLKAQGATTGIYGYGASNGLALGNMGGNVVNPMWATPGEDGDTLKSLSDQLDTVGTNVDDILADTGTDGVVVSPRTVEGSIDEIEALRLVLAALVGKATGGGTATVTFRDTGDTTDRIILTVDSSGNRSAVTLDAS